MADSGIQLTVVIADREAEGSLGSALGAIRDACRGLDVELLVVGDHASSDPEWPLPAGRDVHRLALPRGTLTPVLWGAGARVARGRVVAFTTSQMRVAEGWGRALHDAIGHDTIGAAGAIELAGDAGGATAALYFVRFSAFLPESVPVGGRAMRDIPGDNAAYLGSAIQREEDLLADGFWEVEFHRRFARDGQALRLIPGAEATMGGPIDFTTSVRQRFAHATEFGASRVARHGESVSRVVLAAPLVPLLLVLRIGRRVLPHARYRAAFATSLPWLLALATAWAAGEALGALRSRQRAPGRAR